MRRQDNTSRRRDTIRTFRIFRREGLLGEGLLGEGLLGFRGARFLGEGFLGAPSAPSGS